MREFAECLKDLQGTPEFLAIRRHASPENAKILADAQRFFSTHGQLVRTVRNNTGGHFGIESARYAVRNLDPTAVSKFELAIDEHKANAKLHFAGELVATAFPRGVKGATSSQRIKNAIRTIVEAYKHATGVTQVLLTEYLIDRFG
jgi:hypothetical protein